ncbi:unnamed protein product [Mycena citricolor]|uniref:Peptide hydrolase n=1 Tax=Mycena citricolor TaxID=2018698 RepID=A0AAD2HM21_9AGAR|nr:unnamed protein product [Mycena citricolor]
MLRRTLIFCLLLLPSLTWQRSTLGERALTPLSLDSMSELVSSPDPLKQLDPNDPHSHLSKILIPRVPDTANNTLVRNYIVSKFKALNWHIELNNFEDNTPFGRKNFTNIIVTKDPKATRRIVLAAHFDSKYFPEPNHFLGATDSAAPCALMVDLGESLNHLLDERAARFDAGTEDDEDTPSMVPGEFFETSVFHPVEPVHRHLAEKWATSYIMPHSKRRLMGPQDTEISGIEHFILLDLLGAENPQIRSYTLDTAWLYDALVSVETRLGDSGAYAYGSEQSMAPGHWRSFFASRSSVEMNLGGIGDDHVPFLQKGVDVLHLISSPFPNVWHTVRDDASALHLPTLRRWNIMMRVFFAEYLNLRPDEKKSRDDSSTVVERSETDLRI